MVASTAYIWAEKCRIKSGLFKFPVTSIVSSQPLSLILCDALP